MSKTIEHLSIAKQYDPAAYVVVIDYTNHRGERARRRIRPAAIRFGEAEWHPGPQWLMEAICLEKNAQRTFAMKDIHGWEPDR